MVIPIGDDKFTLPEDILDTLDTTWMISRKTNEQQVRVRPTTVPNKFESNKIFFIFRVAQRTFQSGQWKMSMNS